MSKITRLVEAIKSLRFVLLLFIICEKAEQFDFAMYVKMLDVINKNKWMPICLNTIN